jgi:beta-glucosidase
MSWEITPSALTDLLRNLHTEYNIEEIFITENGSAWEDHCIEGRVDDAERIQYLSQHLQAMDEGINSGVPVRGYFAWSLLDNFEWTHGYTKRFGLVYVDFESQRRIIKSSGHWYARHIALARRNYSQ